MDITLNSLEYFQDLINQIQPNDKIKISSMEVLAQNLKELKDRITQILKKKAEIYFVKENLRFSPEKTPDQERLMYLLSVFENFEQNNILKRRRLGIQKAKLEGKYAKERRKKIPLELQEILLKEREKGMSISEIMQKYKISRKTFYNYAKNSTNKILQDISRLLNNDLNSRE